MNTYWRSSSWRAINQRQLSPPCILLVGGGCSLPGQPDPWESIDYGQTCHFSSVSKTGCTPVSGPLISTELRQCPDSSLGKEGRFKHEGARGISSLLSPRIGMTPAHTHFNARSQDWTSLRPSKAELLPKFSSLPPPSQPTCTPEGCLPHPSCAGSQGDWHKSLEWEQAVLFFCCDLEPPM